MNDILADIAIFTNAKRSRDTQPVLTGRLTLKKDLKAGQELQIALWPAVGKKNGTKYWKGMVSPPFERNAPPAEQKYDDTPQYDDEPGGRDDPGHGFGRGDDIPFR